MSSKFKPSGAFLLCLPDGGHTTFEGVLLLWGRPLIWHEQLFSLAHTPISFHANCVLRQHIRASIHCTSTPTPSTFQASTFALDFLRQHTLRSTIYTSASRASPSRASPGKPVRTWAYRQLVGVTAPTPPIRGTGCKQ